MNLLASARSPYLRSAAHQPVHWHPWSEEAFAEAQRTDRPVLLDVGAVWCHWCHVMDRESYEDPGLAEFLNRHFVCIKVDRDERPDVDARYQRAVQALTGQGGWPLTALLTPEGDVFFGGTYFPPDGQYGRPGFRAVLDSVLRAFQDKREELAAQAGAVRRILAGAMNETAPGPLDPALLERAVAGMARVYDAKHGGFGAAPKFPHPAAIELLLGRWLDAPAPALRDMIDGTLIAMAAGGIHDQLGGGFHRYSTDARWIVPHFEKMSYDNSELLRVYLHAWSVFRTPACESAARGIVRWVREVLADPDGGYGASQDADVGLDDDGDYFTWTLDEAAETLSGDELEVAALRYDIGTAGEMRHHPGKNVLFLAESPERIAERLQLPLERVVQILDSATDKLRAARRQRPAPEVDRTRYTAWNAMMASALLEAGAVLDDDWAGTHALRTLERIRAESPEPDAVPHVAGGPDGLLEDQVQCAAAGIAAWEATGRREWLAWAEGLMERVLRDYWDEQAGGFYDQARDRGGEGLLPTRAKPVQDAPTPSANGVAGMVLWRLAEHTGVARWRDRQRALLEAFAGRADDLGLHGATWLLALDSFLHPPVHLVITGPAEEEEARRMHRRALATFRPRRIVQRITPENAGSITPAPAVASLVRSAADVRAYVCIGAACELPASTDAELAQRLRQ